MDELKKEEVIEAEEELIYEPEDGEEEIVEGDFDDED